MPRCPGPQPELGELLRRFRAYLAGVGPEGHSIAFDRRDSTLFRGFAERLYTEAGRPEEWGRYFHDEDGFFTGEERRALDAEVWTLIQAGVLELGTPSRRTHAGALDFVYVTEAGRARLAGEGPLPEQQEEFLRDVAAKAPGLDEVERFYLAQGLTAFRAKLYPAALVMLGCAGEHLLERIAEAAAPLAKDPAAHLRKVQGGSIAVVWTALSPLLAPRWGPWFPGEQAAAGTAFNTLFLVVKHARDESGHPQLVPPDQATARTALGVFPQAAHYASRILEHLHAANP